MLSSVKSYIYERKNGITKATSLIYSLHILRQYITDRLDEVKDKLEQERVARSNLKSRFYQTQDDVSFTVLALLPTLSDQILEEMDVESLIQDLQHRAGSRNATRALSSSPLSQPPTSISSLGDSAHDVDGRSDSGSLAASVVSTSFSGTTSALDDSSNNNMSTSGLQGWVEASQASVVSLTSDFFAPSTSGMIASSTSSAPGSVSENADSLSSSAYSTHPAPSKAELWSQVKILTFTRTLTVLYSATLLSLFTTVQLTILARYKYIRSIQQMAHEEHVRETLEDQLSLTNLLLGGQGIEDILSTGLLESGEMAPSEFDLSEEAESKYLTLSWWMLHVGWKDVGERARRGVEEVFDGVSLKTRVAAIDLHRLIRDVRRRVEHEITFEGVERRVDFLSSLLPPTPEMTQHVLSQGGFNSASGTIPLSPSSQSSLSSLQDHVNPFDNVAHETHTSGHHIPTQDPHFASLLEETRSVLSSTDFAYVLEDCLDRATSVLFSGLEDSVFHPFDDHPEDEVRVRLAALLPDLARWSQIILRGVPNQLVDDLLAMREVTSLSAIVFSKFEEQSW